MSIAKKVADLIGSSTADSTDASDAPETQYEPTSLYECEPCGTTYISDTMDECPNCGGGVAEVSSERDLGML